MILFMIGLCTKEGLKEEEEFGTTVPYGTTIGKENKGVKTKEALRKFYPRRKSVGENLYLTIS